jgi:hypothetical protein
MEAAMTTMTTTRTRTVRRWLSAGALAGTLAAGVAVPAEAQYRRVQSAPPPAGSEAWDHHGYQLQFTGQGYVRTGVRKVHPYRNLPQVYDLYQGQTWLKRLDYREPGWVAVLTPAAQAPFSWIKHPVNQQATAQNTYLLYGNQHWLTMAQIQAMAGQPAQRQTVCGDGIHNQMGCLGGVPGPVITHGSSVGTGGHYVIGGNTAASPRTEAQIHIDSMMQASQQRIIDRILAPACQSSSYGCR